MGTHKKGISPQLQGVRGGFLREDISKSESVEGGMAQAEGTTCVENNNLEIKGAQSIQEAGRQMHRAPDLARC